MSAGELSAGEVRDLVERVHHLAQVAGDLSTQIGQRHLAVVEAVDGARAEHVELHLRTLPVEALRDATEVNLRLGALRDAGIATVADLIAAGPERLDAVPGVGQQTAAEASIAARALRKELTESGAFRFDVEARPPGQTGLLGALHQARVGETHAAGLRTVSAELVEEAVPLAEAARLAGRRLRFLGGRTRREDAQDAAWQLAALLGTEPMVELARMLEGAAAAFAASVPEPAALWAALEADAASVYAELARHGLDVTPARAVQGGLPAEVAERVEAMALDTSLLAVELRTYQAFGAKFALVQQRVIVGDEMGLGKTIEAIAVLAHLRAGGATHLLVVCPASVLVNWCHELDRHSSLGWTRLHGGSRDAALGAWQRDGGVAVTTFETLRSIDPPEGLVLGALVADEAHYVKNPSAKRTKAVGAWADRTEHVVFLTGTPMENRVEEMRNLVRMLQPQVAAELSDSVGLLGADAFRRAVSPVYLRRNQTDVLAELPDRLEVQEWVELGAPDTDAYRRAVAEGNFMAMRRAAYTPGHPESSAKLARLVELVGEAADSGFKVVVFSFFLDVLDAVAAAVAPTGVAVLGPLTGSTTPEDRQALVEALGAAEGGGVLVSQIQAGGVGLNIQAASVVVLCEPQWKPSTEEQAIARCHRMGQVRRVQVHRLLAEDTVDTEMLRLVAAKAELFDAYARPSALAEASEDALDAEVVSEAEAERQIIERERARLGVYG